MAPLQRENVLQQEATIVPARMNWFSKYAFITFFFNFETPDPRFHWYLQWIRWVCPFRKVGQGAQTASATTSHFVADGERLDFAITSGANIAVIRDASTDGVLELTELG